MERWSGDGPVPELLQEVFVREAFHQWEAIAHGEALVEYAMREGRRHLWPAVDLLSSALVRFSRLFWPDEERRELKPARLARGAALRQLVDAPDEPPEALRRMRNTFEHFDERIDRWYATSEEHGYRDRFVTVGGLAGNTIDPTDHGRHLDEFGWRLAAFGSYVDLKHAIGDARKMVVKLRGGAVLPEPFMSRCPVCDRPPGEPDQQGR